MPYFYYCINEYIVIIFINYTMETNRHIKGLPHNIDKDPDAINMMLWKRKLYKKRIEKNDKKKQKK